MLYVLIFVCALGVNCERLPQAIADEQHEILFKLLKGENVKCDEIGFHCAYKRFKTGKYEIRKLIDPATGEDRIQIVS